MEGKGRGEGRVRKGREEKCRGNKRKGGEARGRGLSSIPPFPNLPLPHWS